MKSEFNSITLSNDLKKKIKGKVLFDEFSRGRYSTDASLYQIKPIGVVLPKYQFDVLNIHSADLVLHQVQPKQIFLSH